MPAFRLLSRLDAAPAAGDRRRGVLVAGGMAVPCAFGRSGTALRKREGDAATPIGAFRLIRLLYRPDRLPRPVTALPTDPIRPDDGWCDDPASPAYNRPVKLPFAAGHERLWRDDSLYDCLVVLDYNLDHPAPGAGSAIFLHIAGPNFAPTAGCVAVSQTAMRRLLTRVGPETLLIVR